MKTVRLNHAQKTDCYPLAMGFAAVCGLIFLLPHFYFTSLYGFTGYEKTLSGDEVEYSARIVNPTPDPYTRETRHSEGPHERLPVLLFSTFERVLGIEWTLIVWDFLGPALLVLALILSARILAARPLRTYDLWALGTAAIVCVCYTYFVGHLNLLYAKGWGNLPIQRWYSLNMHHIASRIFYPAMNLPIFLVGMAWSLKLTRSDSTPGRYALAGGLLGFTIYIRIFDFIVGGACLGLLVLLRIVQNRRTLGEMIRSLHREATILLGFVLVSSYRLYYLLVFRLENPDYLTGAFLRSYRPHFRAIGIAIAFAISVWLLKRWCERREGQTCLFDALLLPTLVIAGAAVSDNLQVILGTNLENGHYWWDYLQPMLAFGGALILLTVLRHVAPSRLVWLAVLTILLGTGSQIVFATRYKDMYRSDASQRAAYDWIRENTEPDAVIGSNYYPSMSVMYTGRRTFFPFSAYTQITLKELLDRYFLTQEMMGYSMPDVFHELLNPDLPFKSESEEMLYHFPTRTSRARCIAQLGVRSYEEILPLIRTCYSEWLLPPDTNPFERARNSGYRLDYLVITDFDRQSIVSNPDRSPYLKRVFADRGVTIYRVLPQQ